VPHRPAGSHADVSVVRTRSSRSASTRCVTWFAVRAVAGRQAMADHDRRGRRPTHRTGLQRLLKAIEEPTERTVWMLCAPTVDDVLPTIRSRCRLSPSPRRPPTTSRPSWSARTASATGSRRTPPAPARAHRPAPGAGRDEATRNRRTRSSRSRPG
jgi:DNA polymerase-3 subunit delta'